MKPAVTLLSASFVLWLVLGVLASLIWGDKALAQSGSACLLCALPAMGTLFWVSRVRDRRPVQQMAAILGGTGLRMFGVLLGGLALFALVPILNDATFWIWILVFYLFTLLVEMRLVLRGLAPPSEGKSA
jgi:hypothetical protein